MGQQLFKVQLDETNNAVFNFDPILSNRGKDDISLFFPVKTSSDPTTNSTELDNDYPMPNSQIDFVKQIQNDLLLLTKSAQWEDINTKINAILAADVSVFVADCHRRLTEEIQDLLVNKKRLRTAVIKKIKSDTYSNVSIFAQPFIDSSSAHAIALTTETENNNDNAQQLPQLKADYQAEQLSYFAIQSLTSILLILIKSAEKNDPMIIHQILTLTSQLCEQLPMNCLSSSNKNTFLIKSLKPLINYIDELSSTNDPLVTKQAMKILLSFSVAKGSFKDILLLLRELIFANADIHIVHGLLIQLNDGLSEILDEWEKEKQELTDNDETDLDPNKDDETASKTKRESNLTSSLDYLKSTGSYPTAQLINLNKDLFTGQFISSIILSHIDIHNQMSTKTKQFQLSSISLEFHPKIFKTLFDIIEQFTIIISSSQSNSVVIHIFTVCLRLFTTHLQVLSTIKSYSDSSSQSNDPIDLSSYATNEELKRWFDLLSKLACDENTEQMTVCKEASKALVYVINIQTSTFSEKLSLMHKYIDDNKYPILVEQLLIELNKTETLFNWIESLFDKNNKSMPLDILYSFIDICFNLPVTTKEEQICKILALFQQILLSRLINQCKNNNLSTSDISLIIEYLTRIFKICIDKGSITNDLFNSILTGLCLMTKSDESFLFEAIQPIFTAVLPLLAEYYLKNINDENNEFISCLIGKMSYVLIVGLPQDTLEIKHMNKLKLPIFAGGYDKSITDKNEDLYNSNLAVYSQFQQANSTEDLSLHRDLLMSFYNNNNEGAELISKLKMFVKDKQPLLLKSIEQQANDACAAIFAVYLKHYRRINLAKYELSRIDQNKPNNQLLSIYEYANRVLTLFGTVKAQGGDCDELYKQIKKKTLFLLLSVKETYLIPIINEQLPSSIIDITPKKQFQLKRQYSQWSKAKNVIKILRNLFQGCIRFKKIILEKKQISEQKYDYESLLNRTIETFIYGHFSKTSITNEDMEIEIDELQKCLCRQHERAIIRLITYRFIKIFIENTLNLKNNNRCLTMLTICLPYLRNMDLDWSYFNTIEASHDQLKEDMSKNYYSIIKLVLPSSLQSRILAQNIFYLLNLSYELIDICQHQFVEKLFISFVSVVQNPEDIISLDLKLTAFNWFRLFLLKLCKTIETENMRGISNQILQQQQALMFNTLILNELKCLKQIKETLPIDSEENKNNSLKDISVGWFIQAIETNLSIISNRLQIELYTNQYLILLLRCIHFYQHVSSVCATIDYIEQLLYIYHHSQSTTTLLFTLKLLRHLIPSLPDNTNETTRNIIGKFFNDLLFSIGQSITSQGISSDIVAELISMYRAIMSINSSWQIIATQLVLDSIKSHLNLKSIETNDTDQMNQLLASLCVLGGYIEPYRLGSIVKNDTDDESQLALIIQIDKNIRDSETPYLIQYFQTNRTESVSIDKLQLEIDVSPPNLLSLLTEKDSFLDTLGSFIESDTSTSESLLLLQLKRRSMSVLYHLLNHTKLVQIFMEKPYASIIAKLSLPNSLEKIHHSPTDLRSFNKQHLQQYCLSLDTCERMEQIIENEDQKIVMVVNDEDDSLYTTWNVAENHRDPLVVNALSKSSGWKPYMAEAEMEFFKQGRIGNDEISIVSMPRDVVDAEAIEECGIQHRFHGRIMPSYRRTTRVSFPTFIIDNLKLNEGKWYYCVRLPTNELVQIGWATDDFLPGGSRGVGDDKYSWSYDGSRGVFFHDEGYYGQYDGLRWKENDVCGCGIEIDGINIKIKYWLNGKFLGTAFAHKSNIPLTDTECNLLPHGSKTTFYPAVTVQAPSYDLEKYCELIFSPEDMQDCPLPDGYKPLLLPKPIHTEHSIVDYPFNAYLVGDDQEDYFYITRMNPTNILLRDFVNEDHLETTLTLENHQLILPNNSTGFLLSIDNHDPSSLTISFDFQILSTDEQLDISLFTLNSTDNFSVPTTLTKTTGTIHATIIFDLKAQQIKVYINNKCRIFIGAFVSETINKLNIHILPRIAAGIKNIGIWKYALSEEHIQRLFTYGLFFIANDYQRLKEYRKQVNTISFYKHQNGFTDGTLVPFNEPFDEEIWEKKKKQVDDNESKYFKSNDGIDHSIIELFGNKTYLVLDKSNETWSDYTLILDISIPHWPTTNERLTLIAFNSKSELNITSQGKLCLESDESNSTVMLNEYFRLFICVREETIQIYLNGILEIDVKVKDNRFQIPSNRIDLFKETDLTKNTTNENTLRISFKSITFLNRSISIDDQLKSPNSSLETLITPPFSVIGVSLIAMGYKKTWIESVLKEYKTTNIYTILREQKQEFIKTDLQNEQKRYLNIFSRLNPSIDQEVLKDLIDSSTFETNEQVTDVAQRIFNQLHKTKPSIDRTTIDNTENWFHQSVNDLGIHHNLAEWIREKSSSTDDENNIYQLLDLNQSKQEKSTIIKSTKTIPKSIKYSHENISREQFLKSRFACEDGLTTIYARDTILNMFNVWSHDRSTLFPLDKFGDYTFLVQLLNLLDYTMKDKDQNIDQMYLLINSILKDEIKQLLDHMAIPNQISDDLLSIKAPLFYHLQKDIIIQSIQYLVKPSLFESKSDDKTTFTERFNLNFILKILNLFMEILTDKSKIKQDQIDLIITFLFPVSFINLIFDLFLLVPTHQSKIFILHLFTTLIQTSENINLNYRIQYFCFQLLIELSTETVSMSTQSRKRFQVALTDLMFVLLARHNKVNTVKTLNEKPNQQFVLSLEKFPENIRDLFTTIDVIIAWTDKTKQTRLPEALLVQSTNILGDGHELNPDDFEKCNNHFNLIADQELINFMNKDPLLNDSFTNFIRSLPTESQPNSTFFKNYAFLSNIPADSIQIRAKFLYLFNKFIEKSLALVDFNSAPGQSILTDHIRTIKIYLLYTTKFELFNESLTKTEVAYTNDYQIVNFDTVKASTDQEISENTMFYQACQQLHSQAHIIFRRPNDQLWQAQYLEMHSTDAGGPYRDSITRICSDICSSRLPLFILCPNGRTNSGLNRDCWIPNVFPANKSISNKFKKQYRFVGQLMGMAIRKKHYLDLKFPILLWKQLLRDQITIEDIQAIDIQSFTMINEMEKNIDQIQSIETNSDIDYMFSSIMSELRFDVVSSAGQTYELIPNGTEIPITAKNFKQYCSSYRQYRLKEFHRQIDLIRQGLYSVIPSYYLSMFTANELEESVCGKGQIDVELLKRNTLYGGEHNQDSPHIQRFWTVLSEMFDDEQRKLFLIFVWGRSTLPRRDEDFKSKFSISSYYVYDGGDVDKTLPRSHTCYFTIDLPEYSTTEIMYDRLNYAITYCSSIDGDGAMNETTTTIDLNLDDILDE